MTAPYLVTLDGCVWVQLSPQQATLLFALMCRKEVSKELAAEMVWPDPDTMPDTWSDCIRLLLHTLRAAIQPCWRILNRPGYGWRLEAVGQ